MPRGVQVPFMFKYAVDGLTLDPTGATPVGAVVALTPAALIAGYGVARAGSALCNELRNATFAKVRCHASTKFDMTSCQENHSIVLKGSIHRSCTLSLHAKV